MRSRKSCTLITIRIRRADSFFGTTMPRTSPRLDLLSIGTMQWDKLSPLWRIWKTPLRRSLAFGNGYSSIVGDIDP